MTSPTLSPGTIGGYIFQDGNRNGVFESGETPLNGEHLYLYDGSGAYLANTYSVASGWYQFTGLADGAYSVQFAPASWWTLRDNWVPDTTGSILPNMNVSLVGTKQADFGWRPIVRSTNANAPLSQYTAPSGLVVQSFDDVVTADTIYAALIKGTLVGSEAQYVTIRFDFSTSGSTSTMAVQTNGQYTSFHATSNVPYATWLDSGDRTLFHEYGHAWSLYYTYMVQQDPTLGAYLRARGLNGDSRVGTSYAWDPKEMIAEDYRELFGTANANLGGQINTDIPMAAAVAGLKNFLETTYMTTPV